MGIFPTGPNPLSNKEGSRLRRRVTGELGSCSTQDHTSPRRESKAAISWSSTSTIPRSLATLPPWMNRKRMRRCNRSRRPPLSLRPAEISSSHPCPRSNRINLSTALSRGHSSFTGATGCTSGQRCQVPGSETRCGSGPCPPCCETPGPSLEPCTTSRLSWALCPSTGVMLSRGTHLHVLFLIDVDGTLLGSNRGCWCFAVSPTPCRHRVHGRRAPGRLDFWWGPCPCDSFRDRASGFVASSLLASRADRPHRCGSLRLGPVVSACGSCSLGLHRGRADFLVIFEELHEAGRPEVPDVGLSPADSFSGWPRQSRSLHTFKFVGGRRVQVTNFDAMPLTPPQEVSPRKPQPPEVGCARSSPGMPPGLSFVGPLQELGHTHFEIRCSSQCWRLTGCDPAEPRSPCLCVWPQSSRDLAMVSFDPLVRNFHFGDVRSAEQRYFSHSAERGKG